MPSGSILSRQHMSVQQAAEAIMRGFSTLGSFLLGNGILILFGLDPLPSSPLAPLLSNHWLVGALISVTLAVLIIAFIVNEREHTDSDKQGMARHVTTGVRLLRFLASTIFATVFGGGLGILFGINALPSSLPIINLLRTRPPLALALIGVLLAFIIFSPLLSQPPSDDERPNHETSTRIWTATVISLVSSALFLSLLATVIIRPTWCPTAICPAPQRILVTRPGGVHDNNIEMYLTAIQSSAYELPADPGQQSLAQTPSQSAVLISQQFPAYKVVIGIHSLQQHTIYGIIIQQVSLVVDRVTPTPTPLNAWVQGSAGDYHTEPYLAVYQGGGAGTLINATYTPLPVGHVQLQPGESDELDIQVTSQRAVSLTFHVQIEYRVINEGNIRTLTLSKTLTAAFANAEQWRPYSVTSAGLSPCANALCTNS